MQEKKGQMLIDHGLLSEMIEIYAKRRGQLNLEQEISVISVEAEDEEILVDLIIKTPWVH